MKLLAIAAVLAVASWPVENSDTKMRAAATDFIATLNDAQRKEALLSLADDKRTAWLYVPGVRPGVAWSDMDESQKLAARKLLQASLSEAGYKRVEVIRNLEATLRAMESNNLSRDTEKYWFIFFGEPSEAKPWAWRYEGHHVSLNFTMSHGSVVASTPQFLGANPAEIKSGPLKGTRPLAKEQDLAFQLMESLSASQAGKARIADVAPNDIITGNARKAAIQARTGLSKSDLTNSQRRVLAELIRAHSEVQADAERSRRLDEVAKDGDDIVFAWMGPVQRSGRHYYRIQGKSFLIEFDDTQDDGNHIHTVWRDFDGDFGEDTLAEHYLHGHHHQHR